MINHPHGPHPSHCCPIHGCKYSHKNCPVANQEYPADHQCEECQESWAEYKHYECQLDDGTWVTLQNIDQLFPWIKMEVLAGRKVKRVLGIPYPTTLIANGTVNRAAWSDEDED